MSKYTIPEEIDFSQSVGPSNIGDRNESDVLGVFEPAKGRDLIYKNPKYNNGSLEEIASYDNRIPLGTYTLNDRGYWENNITNELTYSPYFTKNSDNFKPGTLDETIRVTTPNGKITDVRGGWATNDLEWSVDALPFVINPNNDDIIPVDRYYDKKIESFEYSLATEGKINYYINLKDSGRISSSMFPNTFESTPSQTGTVYEVQDLDIDLYDNRSTKTKNNGDNFFDYYQDTSDESNKGFYLFKLNWGDGTPIEHANKPKLLESTIIFEHFYKKPGFYSITGIIYQYTGESVRQYERFQTNILLNPSPNFEMELYNDENFATIGNFSKKSVFIKSLYNLVGINPLPPNSIDRAEEASIEKINTFDKVNMLGVLGKIDYSLIQPYHNLLSPYQSIITDEPQTIVGCTISGSHNYNPDAVVDDGSCYTLHDIHSSVRWDGELQDVAVIRGDNEGQPSFIILWEGNGQSGAIEVPAGGYGEYTSHLFEPLSLPNGNYTLTFEMDLNFNNGWIGANAWSWEGWYNGSFDENELLTTNQTVTIELGDSQITSLNARVSYSDTLPPDSPTMEVYNNTSFIQTYGSDWTTNPLFTENSEVFNILLSNYQSANSDVLTNYNLLILQYPELREDDEFGAYGDLDYFEIQRTYYDYIQDIEITESLSNIPYPTGTSNIIAPPILDGPLPYQEYTYKVRSVDQTNFFSEWVELEPIRPDVTDLIPVNLQLPDNPIIQFSNYEIQFSWIPVNDFTEGIEGDFGHYLIQVINPVGVTVATEQINDMNQSTYIYEQDFDISPHYLIPSGNFLIKIKVVDGSGNESGWVQESIFIQESAKIFINDNLNISNLDSTGFDGSLVNPPYPTGYNNLFFDAANTLLDLSATSTDQWQFNSFELGGGGNNPPLVLSTNNRISLGQNNYQPEGQDITMTLNINYSWIGDSSNLPQDLATIDIELLPPQNPSGNDTDEATYSWNSGNDETQLTTNFDFDSAVISAPNRVVSMVSLIRQGGGSNEIGQDQNQAVVGGVRFTLNGGNLTAQNENEMEGSFESIEVQAIMTSTEGGGGGGGNSCFLEGTMITMVDGSQLPIEDIQVGMKVLSFDGEANKITHNKVVELFHHTKEESDAYLIINDNIRVTENHHIYVSNNRFEEDWGDSVWIRADEILIGDYLYDKDFNKIIVNSIEKINESVVTYNFEVENTHTYFAENVIVHNIGGGGPGGGSGKKKTGDTVTETADEQEGYS